MKESVLNKLKDVSRRLGFPWQWLGGEIQFESGWVPDIVYGGKRWSELSAAKRAEVEKKWAIGLIQFVPKTRRGLGVTAEQIARMTTEDQLELVYEYLKPYAGRIRTPIDLAAAVFWPAAIGHGPDYVVGSKDAATKLRRLAYKWNAALDKNHDGRVTMAEYVRLLRRAGRKWGVDMDVVSTYLEMTKQSRTLADLIAIAGKVKADTPRNTGVVELMDRTIRTLTAIAKDYVAKGGLTAKINDLDADYRSLLNNRIRVAFSRPTSFEPTLKDYKEALVETAQDVQEVAKEAAGIGLPVLAVGAVLVYMLTRR